MITCKRCNTENLDGSQYCDECGAILTAPARARKPDTEPTDGGSEPAVSDPGSAAPAVAPAAAATPETSGVLSETRNASEPRLATRSNAVEAVNTAIKSAGTSALSGGPESPDASARGERRSRRAGGASGGAGESGSRRSSGSGGVGGSSSSGSGSVRRQLESSGALSANNGPHAKLVIHRGRSVGKEFPLNDDEAHIGRWDADGGIFPDVDLDSDDPEAKVSRRHARITRRNGQYYIEDLGSTNGTFINRGRRLLPGDRQPLRDGDEVIVGKTFLRFQVIK
jgi:hypothetical protein